MRINNIYHQLPDLKLDHCFSTHHSASTATSRLNIHTYSHRYARRHTHCNLRQAPSHLCMHTYIQASPQSGLTSFLELRTKQKQGPCTIIMKNWKMAEQSVKHCRSWHTLHTHVLALPLPPQLLSHDLTAALLCTSFYSGTKKSWSLFTLYHLKWVYQAIWTYQMSAGRG